MVLLQQVDLSSGQVITIAGTGVQGDDKQGGKPGTQQALSSPWDVGTGVSPGNLSHQFCFCTLRY